MYVNRRKGAKGAPLEKAGVDRVNKELGIFLHNFPHNNPRSVGPMGSMSRRKGEDSATLDEGRFEE